MICRGLLTAVLIAFVITSSARAQTPLAQVIPTMLGSDVLIAPGPGGTHAQEFSSGVDLNSVPRGFDLNSAIVEQITTFPTGSSSGGFLYSFDPALGTFTRTTRSFGPSYVDRPQTSGRGTVSVGFTTQNVEYDRFDGTPLDGSDIRFYSTNRNLASAFCPGGWATCTPPSAELSDVVESTLRLRIKSQTFLTTFSVGLTDRLDVGVTLPFVKTTLEATVNKRILRLGTAATPTVHSFDGAGADTASASGGGTASGVGDIRVQAKYHLVNRPTWSFSGLGDMRLPTGDGRNLLGNGTSFFRVLGLFSTGNRIASAHASGGMTFASGGPDVGLIGEPDDEINSAFGVDWSAAPRVTVNGDVLIRMNAYGDYYVSQPTDRTLRYTTTTGQVGSTVVREFQTQYFGGGPEVKAVFGGKVSAWRTLLLSGNVLFAATDHGLRNKPALSFGAEYTF